MKKRFRVKGGGTACDIGDTIALVSMEDSPFGFGSCETMRKITLDDDDIINLLVKRGILEPIETEEETFVKKYMEYASELAEELNFEVDDFLEFLGDLYCISPLAVLQLFTKKIADSLRTKDDIPNEKWYYISVYNGKTYPLNKKPSNPKYAKVMAVFKTKEQAEYARNVLKRMLLDVYGEQKD